MRIRTLNEAPFDQESPFEVIAIDVDYRVLIIVQDKKFYFVRYKFTYLEVWQVEERIVTATISRGDYYTVKGDKLLFSSQNYTRGPQGELVQKS